MKRTYIFKLQVTSLVLLLAGLAMQPVHGQDNPSRNSVNDTTQQTGIPVIEQEWYLDSSGNKFFSRQIVIDIWSHWASRAHWNYILPESMAAAASTPMVFAQNRPTVVVLIHGVTGYPFRNDKIGRIHGSRFEWGYDFVTGLLGDVQQRPHTFADASDATGVIGRGEWETKHIDPTNVNHHFITLYGVPNPSRNHYPFSLMLTYRDGSISMKKQVAHTAGMITSLYQSAFGSWPANKQPQIILLCHSFGGLVARTICSNPSSIPSNNSEVPVETFTVGERRNMDFIRNRTVHITTLATPHEGSQMTMNAELGSILQHMIPQVRESDPDTEILKQLNTFYVSNLNRTILQANLCRRSNLRPIPIHAIGGRVPAGPSYFSNPNVHDNDLATVDGGIGRTNIDALLANGSNREAFESYNLLRVDYAMHMFFGNIYNGFRPWGITPADNPRLDIIQTRDVHFPVPCLISPHYNLASFGAKPRLYYLRNQWIENRVFGVCTGTFFSAPFNPVSDGEIDNDGFVPINSALGVKLGTNTTNVSANTAGGSWYRFYRSAADFHNHGTIKTHAEVGRWVRQNIIGNDPTTLLFGTLHRDIAAGPNVATTGTRSIW